MSKKITAYMVALAVLICVAHPPSAYGAEVKDDGKGAEHLVIGLVPEINIFEQKRRYQPIMDYLSKKTGREVRSMVLPRYGGIVDFFRSGEIQAAFHGSFGYAFINDNVGIVPVTRPVWKNGSSTYTGYIITRRDSGLTADVKGWKGKRLALVHKTTTAGYFYPLSYLRQRGIKDMEDYFDTVYFAGSHDAAAMEVFEGAADIGAVKNHIFNKIADKNPDFKREMLILDESSEVPSNTLSVRSDISPEFIGELKEILKDMEGDPEGRAILDKFGAARFIDTADEDFKPVYDIINLLNVDLSSYK